MAWKISVPISSKNASRRGVIYLLNYYLSSFSNQFSLFRKEEAPVSEEAAAPSTPMMDEAAAPSTPMVNEAAKLPGRGSFARKPPNKRIRSRVDESNTIDSNKKMLHLRATPIK